MLGYGCYGKSRIFLIIAQGRNSRVKGRTLSNRSTSFLPCRRLQYPRILRSANRRAAQFAFAADDRAGTGEGPPVLAE